MTHPSGTHHLRAMELSQSESHQEQSSAERRACNTQPRQPKISDTQFPNLGGQITDPLPDRPQPLIDGTADLATNLTNLSLQIPNLGMETPDILFKSADSQFERRPFSNTHKASGRCCGRRGGRRSPNGHRLVPRECSKDQERAHALPPPTQRCGRQRNISGAPPKYNSRSCEPDELQPRPHHGEDRRQGPPEDLHPRLIHQSQFCHAPPTLRSSS